MKNNNSYLAVVGVISFNVALALVGYMFLRTAQKNIAQIDEANRVIDENKLNEHLRETGQLN